MEHAVNNIGLRLLIVLDIGGAITKCSKARKAEKGDMENVKQMFLQSHF